MCGRIVSHYFMPLFRSDSFCSRPETPSMFSTLLLIFTYYLSPRNHALWKSLHLPIGRKSVFPPPVLWFTEVEFCCGCDFHPIKPHRTRPGEDVRIFWLFLLHGFLHSPKKKFRRLHQKLRYSLLLLKTTIR